MTAILLENVTKAFGEKRAVDGISLSVERGRVVGIIGPNGAGKTTTIRMILGILRPDSGRVEVLGGPLGDVARARIGYLPEERGVYRRMRVGAFVAFLAELRGVAPVVALPRAEGTLAKLGLVDILGARLEELSKGMQQKVQLAATLAHDPELVILDEPWSGLDPVASRALAEVVAELRARERAVLISTHLMPQAEALCDRVVMVHRGRKVLDRDLHASEDGPARAIAVELASGEDLSIARTLPGVLEVARAGKVHTLSLAAGTDPQAIIRALVESVAIRRVELVRPSLEETFVSLVGQP